MDRLVADSVAEALVIVRDKWTFLIIRELFFGVNHFTEKGRDLYGLTVALMQWGDRWLVDDPPLSLRHKTDHGEIEQVIRCKACGETLSVFDIDFHYDSEAVHKHAQKGSTAAAPDRQQASRDAPST